MRVTPRIVNQRLIEGYQIVTLRKYGHQHTVKVHRLIAAAFIRPPAKNEVINHVDGDRKNNKIENLEWTTPKGNNAHTVAMGRRPYGTQHPLGKIDYKIAFEMRKQGHNYSGIARHFKVSKEAVSQMFKRAIRAGRYKD